MECEGVCPYCGQPISFFVDEGGLSRQRYVEDCSVCCRPIELDVSLSFDEEEGESAALHLSRGDD